MSDTFFPPASRSLPGRIALSGQGQEVLEKANDSNHPFFTKRKMRPEKLAQPNGQVFWWSAGPTLSSIIQAILVSGPNSVLEHTQKGGQTQAPSGQIETHVYFPGLEAWSNLPPKAF